MTRLRPLPPLPLLAMAFAMVVIGLSTVAGVGYAVFHRTTAVELVATVDVIGDLADEFAVSDSTASSTTSN